MIQKLKDICSDQLENSKLILIFLGYKHTENFKHLDNGLDNVGYSHYIKNNDKSYLLNCTNFHSNWNELIDVCNYISTIEIYDNVNKDELTTCFIDIQNKMKTFNIDLVFDSVIRFIKQYNNLNE